MSLSPMIFQCVLILDTLLHYPLFICVIIYILAFVWSYNFPVNTYSRPSSGYFVMFVRTEVSASVFGFQL